MSRFNPKFMITNRMTSAITRIERARGFLEAAHLSPEWIREMGDRALILEAHHTTHIEGTRLTLEKEFRDYYIENKFSFMEEKLSAIISK